MDTSGYKKKIVLEIGISNLFRAEYK